MPPLPVHTLERVTGICKSSAGLPINTPASWEHGHFLVLADLALGSAISLSVVSPGGRPGTRDLAPQCHLAISGSLRIRWS